MTSQILYVLSSSCLSNWDLFFVLTCFSYPYSLEVIPILFFKYVYHTFRVYPFKTHFPNLSTLSLLVRMFLRLKEPSAAGLRAWLVLPASCTSLLPPWLCLRNMSMLGPITLIFVFTQRLLHSNEWFASRLLCIDGRQWGCQIFISFVSRNTMHRSLNPLHPVLVNKNSMVAAVEV